ncbi:hypothetical protein B1813_02775 [Saccharomonospora piscinae]|uniref:YdbS-like PH domain-containing protein n=1 Tax=Saccharomonospora piscinae TaxID=687388 RepID=A0A1V9AD38_SACPI|nr:PH domain-containing protein [Saccharomonospora piscinae]OQO95001.1 hypothetical protein B1813_02775 [Saccharomonospora piscinae]TLW90394.1 hypothetical protein FFT09_20985 [Saccharomonospora piscinae]
MTGPVAAWRQLDRLTVAVTALRVLGVSVAAAVPSGYWLSRALSPGAAVLVLVSGVLVVVAGACVVDHLRWRRFHYRVLPDRFELRKGIVVRSRRSLHRDRIRAVDISASPLLRLFRLVHVKVGTGEQTEGDESSLSLQPVRRGEADRLRRALLDHAAEPGSGPRQSGVLSTLDPAWVRYAPVSFVTPALGAAAFGAVLQVAQWFGLESSVVTWVLDRLRALPLLTAIVVLVVIGMIVGAIAAAAVFVEMWWQYRLEREPGGTLRVRRGLLTTRSLSVEERRLRGVDLVEPLGNRLLGAARVDAIATGLTQRKQDQQGAHNTLQPAAPRAVADRVAAAVLREAVSPTAAAGLRSHPRAARGRRVRWALAAVAAVELPLVVLGLTIAPVLLIVAGISAVVLVPVAVGLAFAAYRSLGHGITGDYLVVRHGPVRRSTAALQRGGVIGWRLRQSYFQRRRGLLTVTATTAAGAQAYSAHDADRHAGLAFADEAVVGLLAPFLERAEP